jgi:hypothetical protein
VELLKAALVGSADSAPSAPAVAEEAGGAACSASGGSQTPEDLLDSLHATLSATLQDAAHQIAPEHHEAWAEGQWEAFQEAHNAVQRMLLGLHSQAAQGGCAGGALQVSSEARGCLPSHVVFQPACSLAAPGCKCQACTRGPVLLSCRGSLLQCWAEQLSSTMIDNCTFPATVNPYCRLRAAWSTVC